MPVIHLTAITAAARENAKPRELGRATPPLHLSVEQQYVEIVVSSTVVLLSVQVSEPPRDTSITPV